MAFRRVKALFKTAIIITIVSSLLNSGCSFSFTGNKLKDSDNGKQTSEFCESVSGVIEKTDFKNNEELTESANEIKDLAKQFAKDEESLDEFQKASIVRVVDGDTIVVDIDGQEDNVTVRLIGVNTPESVASEEYLEKWGITNSEEGKQASAFTKQLLSNYEFVYLQKDVEDKDIYGRDLRYVWLNIPTNDQDLGEIATEMRNGVLISEGYAEVATYYPNVAHKEHFEALEAQRLSYGDLDEEEYLKITNAEDQDDYDYDY